MPNHTATHIAATGGTYYAYPAHSSATYSLANWATHRVQLAELSAPNLGTYQGTLDDAKGFSWLVFAGSSQPASWDSALAEIDLTSDEVGKIHRSATAVPAGSPREKQIETSGGTVIKKIIERENGVPS